jgi:hypothetical protein
MKKKARYRNIPIYYETETGKFKGRNIFYEIFLVIRLWIDLEVLNIEIGNLPIYVELTEKEKKMLGTKDNKI